jgi:hypothetical protein
MPRASGSQLAVVCDNLGDQRIRMSFVFIDFQFRSVPRYHDFYFFNKNPPLATDRLATNSPARSTRGVLAIRATCRARSVREVS